MHRLSAVALGLLLAVPSAAGEPDLEKDLGRPVSPGSLAILLAHAKDPRVRERWSEGLGASDPQVRATAARLAAVSGAASLMPAAAAALQSETDAMAAAEEIRVLVAYGDDAQVEQAVAASLRVGGLAVESLASALAGRYGPQAHQFIERLRDVEDVSWEDFFWRASRGAAANLAGSGSVVLRLGDASLLRTLLRVSREADGDLPDGPIQVALAAEDPALRSAAYEHLALECGARPVSDAVRQAFASGSAPGGPEETGVVGVLRILAQRRCHLSGTSTPDVSWQGIPPDQLERFGYGALWQLLRSGEQETLVGLLGGSRGHEVPRASAPGPRPPARSVDRVLPVVADSVFHVAGCSEIEGGFAAAKMSFFPDGRPRSVQMLDAGLEESCQEAGFVVLATSLSPLGEGVVPEEDEFVLLPLRKPFFEALAQRGACTPRPDEGARTPRRVGPGIVAPRKTLDSPPVYPQAARKAGLQGPVVLAARVEPTGCLDYVAVAKPLTPMLDWAALLAVSGWRYSPALLDGKPVEVQMSVTIDFKLR